MKEENKDEVVKENKKIKSEETKAEKDTKETKVSESSKESTEDKLASEKAKAKEIAKEEEKKAKINEKIKEVNREIREAKEREELYDVFKKESVFDKIKKFFRRDEDEKKFDKWCVIGIITGLLIVFLFEKALFVRSWISPLENVNSVSNKLNEINFFLNRYWLYDKDLEKIEDMISLGMMAGLGDRYANYYKKDDVKKLRETIVGEYVGIGIVVVESSTDATLIVSKIYDDSPAKESGLEVGDKIIAVDDNSVSSLSIDEVLALVKGKEGTIVKLSIRKESGELKEINVTRKKVEVPETIGYMMADNIAYVSVTSFEGKAYSQFLELQAEFIEQGVEGMIIDLRNNTGGNLSVLKNLAGVFLDNKLITYFEKKVGTRDEYYASEGSWDIPLVILVNGYSASASEAFAGAMQDYERATLVGTTTFGKGVVQEIYSLTDGSAIKFTIAKYFTPKGRNFDGEGIVPDVIIEPLRAEGNQEVEDIQLTKAVEIVKEKINGTYTNQAA